MLGPLWEALLDLVLPRECVGCRRAGTAVCAGCRPSGPPLLLSAADVPVAAAGRYEAGLRSAVLAYKERGRRDLAAPLAELLAAAAAELLAACSPCAGPPLLVPVPSRPGAAAARGGDHLHRLVARVSRRTGLRAVRGALAFTRPVADSTGLDVGGRAGNLAGALRALPPPAGAGAVIVDDVFTTGATVRETTRALRAAGWPVIGAAVIAATPRRHLGTPLAASSPAV